MNKDLDCAFLQVRVWELEAAIRTHRNQKADDRCIEDDDRLYAALGDGVKCDRRVGCKEAMYANCRRFIDNRCEKGGWLSYVELEAERDRLKLDSDLLQFVLRVLRVFDGFDGPDSDCLWWCTDGKYAPATFFVKCSDLFHWGSADLEPITAENISVLEQCVVDLGAISGDMVKWHADTLFCARVRKMRPQGAVYPNIDESCWPLFDACGPEREVGIGNPYSREKAVENRKRMEAKIADQSEGKP